VKKITKFLHPTCIGSVVGSQSHGALRHVFACYSVGGKADYWTVVPL